MLNRRDILSTDPLLEFINVLYIYNINYTPLFSLHSTFCVQIRLFEILQSVSLLPRPYLIFIAYIMQEYAGESPES